MEFIVFLTSIGNLLYRSSLIYSCVLSFLARFLFLFLFLSLFVDYLAPGVFCSLQPSIAVIFINLLVIRDSQVLAKLGAVTIFFSGWGQTARLQRVRQNTADRIQTETEQQQTARLQRVRQNTADRILKFDKRYKAFEIAGYFQKHRELIG